MVRVSPAARKSKLLSAALNVAVTNPPPGPLVIEVVSADPSTALSPPGGVSPPDQVIEARLTLSVLGVELVKLKVVVGAVSSPVLPVMWDLDDRLHARTRRQQRRRRLLLGDFKAP